MYWLGRVVKRHASGKPNRPYAKWHVLHLLWRQVKGLLNSKRSADYFRLEAERSRWSPALDALAEQVYQATMTFYRINRGEGESGIDASNFFYRANQHRKLQVFWRSPENKRKLRAENLLKHFARDIEVAISK
jgi:hypothetical protein